METGVVIIQEPVPTKISDEETLAGVVTNQSSMEVDKVNLTSFVDEEITSRDFSNNIPGEAEVVNGSGNEETERFECKKGEATENMDHEIVKEKASKTANDEQDSIFVHEPESFNTKISDMTSKKEKEDDITQKQEELTVEKPIIEAETKHSPEQEKEIGNISTVLIDTAPDKGGIEKSLNLACVPMKTDEQKEEKDSTILETSINGTEAEHNVTVSAEENIVNETAPTTDSESLPDVETTKRVFLEVEKKEEEEEIMTEAEPRLDAKEKEKEETKAVKTVVEIVTNEETTSHESGSLKGDDYQRENTELVEEIKNSEDAEQISTEVTVNGVKEEEDVTRKKKEVQESPTVIEMPTIQGEDTESKTSKDTEEHEPVLVRDIPQSETLETQHGAVNTLAVQEAAILKALETTIDETEAVHSAKGGEGEGQETKEGTKPTLYLKEDKEQEETVMVILSDEGRPSDQVDVQAEESFEVKPKETVQDESSEQKLENLLDVQSGESEKYQDNEPKTALVNKIQFEETPSDLTLKVDKKELKEDAETKVDQVDGTQTMQEQIGLDVESIEKMQKPSLESPSEEPEETSKTVDDKIEERPQEVTLHQKVQEQGSYGLETKEETSTVPESIELGEQAREEESRLPDEQEKETKFQIEKHEPKKNEVPSDQQSPVKEKSDEVIQDSSSSPSEELEGEIVIEDINVNEEEQVANKVQKILETVETVEPHSSLPSSSQKQEHGTVAEVEKTEGEKVKDAKPMGDISERSPEIAETKSSDLVSEFEELKPEQAGEILQEERKEVEEARAERLPFSETGTVMTIVEEKDTLVHDEETTTHESESLKDITRKIEEVQESPRVIGEEIESKASPEVKEKIDQSSKDTEEHEHMLGRDMPQNETIVTEAEAIDTSTVQESAILKILETKEDTETILDLKEDKEQEVKTVISPDEVKSSDVQAEELGDHTKPCSLEIKDESHEREESVEVKSIQEESNGKHENLVDVPSGESEKYKDNEPEIVLESVESLVSIEGDETKEDQTLVNVESVEKMQKLTLESPSEVSAETSTTVDEKIENKPEEEVTLHQEGQEEGSHGLETKEETVPVPKSSELEEKSMADPTPPQEEKETKLHKEQIEKHELRRNEEVPNDHQSHVEEKSDEVLQVSSASPPEELEDETVIEDRNIEDKKVKEAEPTGNMSEKCLEITDLSFPLEASKSDETESSDLVSEVEEHKPKQAVEILERDITHKTEEVQESFTIIETSTTQGEDIESKSSQDHQEEIDKISKETEEHEHVLVRDMPQADTLVTEAETVDTSIVQEFPTLKTLDTNLDRTEEVDSAISGDEEGQDTKTSLDLKEDKEQELKTVISSDEVRSSDVQVEEFGEHTKPCSLEIKDESQRREESVEFKSNETSQDGSNDEKKEKNLLDVSSGESEKYQDNESETVLVAKTESLVAVEGNETIHDQALLDVESVEQMQKQTLELPFEVSAEITKTEDKKIEEKPEEGVIFHQEGQEKGSYGLETKEKTVTVPESSELGEKSQEERSIADLTPPQQEETNLKIQKHEPTNKEDINDQQSPVEERSDEVIQIPSSSPSVEREGVAVVQAGNIGDLEINEEEQVTENIQKSLEIVEIVEPNSSLPSSSEDKQGNGTVSEKIEDEKVEEEPIVQIISEEDATKSHESQEEFSKTGETTVVQEEQTKDIGSSLTEKSFTDQTQAEEHAKDEQKKEIKYFDEEIHIPSIALTLDEQERVISTEKGETKPNESEDDKADEHVDSSTSPMFSEKNDNETLIAEANQGDDDTSENVCIKQEELGKLEAPKLEDTKEDKRQEISETIEATSDRTLPIETSEAVNTPSSELVSGHDDQTPKKVEEIHEEEIKEADKVEPSGDQNLAVETSHTPSSDLVSELNDQTPKKVEDIHEDETKEADKLQAQETLPTKIIPRESSGEALVSMLTSREEGNGAETEESAGETKPKEAEDGIHDQHVETPTSPTISKKNDNEILVAEPKKGDENINETEKRVDLDSSGTSKASENVCIKQEEFGKPEAPKTEESKEEKSQEIHETTEAIEATGDQTLSIETSQAEQTLPSELVSGLDDQTPRKVEEIHEEETKEEHKFEATSDQSLPVETSQADQTPSTYLASGLDNQIPKQVEETHEEEKTEAHKLQVVSEQISPVETTQADQTPASVSEQDDQTSEQVKEIHEQETNKTENFPEEESLPTETVPRESFSESPVSILASAEDEPVTLQEGNFAGGVKETNDQQEERPVSAETKPKESEAEVTRKSDDQVETSTKVTKVEDEETNKMDIKVGENACLKQEHGAITEDQSSLRKDNPYYPEHDDGSSSTLPVVEILKGLQTTLETDREISDSTSLGANMITEKADQEQKKGDAEVDSSEKDSAAEILQANNLRQDKSGETEKVQEETGLAGKSFPIEELNSQEEHKEEVKVQDVISREFEVNVKEKIQEETRDIAECKEEIPADGSLIDVLPAEKILIASSHLPSEELEHVISTEKQEEHKPREDVNASISEKINLQEEHPRDFETSKKEEKAETHETVKEEDQTVDIKEEKKSEEVQDEKLLDLSATKDIKETFSSEVEKDKEDASELGSVQDFVSPDVEKEKETHSVLGSEEEINKVVTSEKKITELPSEAEKESNEEHVEPQAVSDDTKSNDDKSLTKEALDEQFQVPSSAVLDDFQENSNPEVVADLSVKKPNEVIQSNQFPNRPLEENVEETSFEVKKAQEDKNEDALIKNENVQVQDQLKDFEASAKDKETTEQEQKPDDVACVQEDVGTNFKVEDGDDEIRGDGHDSVLALKEETGLIEEKREVEYVKTGLEDEIKNEVEQHISIPLTSTDKVLDAKEGKEEPKNIQSTKVIPEADLNKVPEQSQVPIAFSEGNKTIENEEKKNVSEEIDPSFIREATKEIYQEDSKQAYVKEDTQEQVETNVKNTDDVIEKTQPEIREIESLSSINNTQEKLKQKDEVPNQQKREIAQEKLKIAEELQNKDEESENTKDLFSQVKEPEPTVKEPERKSISDLIHKVKETNKIEDATTKPAIEEEAKTEEEDENGDEHKDEKTSPDSIVMVEAKDTVQIIKTHHKKSQGILSGVGSKVKHSISKVKKVLTGKSSHTTKPSSPK